MSVFDDIEEFGVELDSFSHKLYAVVLKNWEHVSESFDSDKLEGMDLSQVKARLMKIVTDHTSQMNVNVHDLTPADLDTLSKQVVSNMIDELTDFKSDTPYSFWDRQNFLPPQVTSTFASGVYEPQFANSGMCLEDNGDLSILRNGTDGTVKGVFYSLIRDAVKTVAPVMDNTNVRYQPASLEPHVPIHIHYASKDTIIGKYGSIQTGRVDGFFVGLTYGTLDQTLHDVVKIPFTSIGDTIQIFAIPYKTKVMVFRAIELGEWEVYDITMANIRNGVPTVTRNNGWRVKLANGSFLSTDVFKHAVKYGDLHKFTGNDFRLTSVGGQGPAPGYSVTAGLGDVIVTYDTNVDGTVDIRLRYRMDFRSFDGLAGKVYAPAAIDVKISDDKIIDSQYILSNIPVVNYGSGKITFERKGIYGFAHPYEKGVHSRISEYIGRDRHYSVSYEAETNKVVAFIFTFDPSKRAEYKKDYTSLKRQMTVSCIPNFPTGIETSMSVTSVTPTQILVETGEVNDRKVVQCRIDTANEVQFNGISGIQVNGFKLNLDRVPSTVDVPTFRKIVSQTTSTSSTILAHTFSIAGGIPLLKYEDEVKGVSHSPVLSSSRTAVTFSEVLYNKITTDITALLKTKIANLGEVVWELVVPTSAVAVTPFITFELVSGTGSRTKAHQNGIIGVTVSISGNILTGVTLTTATLLLSPATSAMYQYIRERTSTVTAIRTCSDGTMIYTTSVCMTATNNAGYHTGVFSYRFTGGKFTIGIRRLHSRLDNFGAMNHPSLGLYTVHNSPRPATIDGGTKAIGRRYVTTSSNVTPVVPGITNSLLPTDKVIISSAVPDTWSVYISDDIECMINGQYGIVPKTSFELHPTNDAWKVFHVWLKLVGTTFSYEVERTDYKLNVTNAGTNRDNALYLGYFSTDRLGVNSISMEKSIAVGGYRLSEWKAGKSIPVSTDFPMDLDKLNWV